MPSHAASAMNAAQLRAVHHTHSPCLVLAGAGSGKTRVITHKMAHLIRSGVAPRRIAAITFTNKAATEMRTRVRELAGAQAQDVLVCTFHALGVRLLREDGEAIGLKSHFSILDADDSASLIKEAGGGTADLATARRWQWTISRWKNMGLTPQAAAAQASSNDERMLAQVMERYAQALMAYQSVDFDDLIGLPLALLRTHDGVREKWQQRFAHILVDEYQDTNAMQYELLRLLVGQRVPFTAVGDDDQSIYAWRGATLDNLRRLPQDYPQLQIIKLEQNYRSTGAILQAANRVIAANGRLFPKRLFSELGDGEPVRVLEADSEEHEAQRIVAHLQALRASAQQREWGDFAILYRANHMARPLEQALQKAQIPYRVSGGTSFFDRAEIRDLCAWLRLWSNGDDNPAFIRAATAPRRGIGQQTLAQLGQFAAQHRISLFAALFNPMLPGVIQARAIASLNEFGRHIHELAGTARHTVGEAAARDFLKNWLDDTGFERHLRDSSDNHRAAAARWANVLDFCDWIAHRCGGSEDAATGLVNQPQSLLDVAQTVALISTLQERGREQNVLTLSTLHAAKGLEWPHVVLAGVNEGMLPFSRDDSAATDEGDEDGSGETSRLEEERRLMYVGITRARQTLVVTWARKRRKGRRMLMARPSRFIAEMMLNEENIPREDPREKLRLLRERLAARAGSAAGSA